MNSVFKNVGTFVMLALLLACGQKAGTKKFLGGPSEFKPNTVDAKLDRKAISEKSVEALFVRPVGSYYLKTSDEILELSETLLDLSNGESDATRRLMFIQLAEKVRSAYYSNSNNYSTFDQNTSTYLELALGLAFDGPENLQNLVNSGLSQQQTVLSKALESLSLKLEPQVLEKNTPAPNVSSTIRAFESFLKSIPRTLINGHVQEKVVSGIQQTLEKDYLPLLVSARTQLEPLSVAHHPLENILRIESAISGFSILPKSFRDPLLKQIEPVKKLAQRIAQPKNEDELFDLLFELWSNPDMREKFKEASVELYDMLTSMSPEQIAWLKQYNLQIISGKSMIDQSSSWWKKMYQEFLNQADLGQAKEDRILSTKSTDAYELTFKLYYAKRQILKIGLSKIIRDLERAVNVELISQLDAALRANASVLVSTVSEKIEAGVDESFLNYKQNLKDILRTEGRLELGKRIFDKKSAFVAVEDSRSALLMNKDSRFLTVRNSNLRSVNVPKGAIVSSSKTLGLALSLQAKRLILADSSEAVSKSSAQYNESVFTPLNKMMAIGGFKYMEKNLPRFAGLNRLIYGSSDGHEMDMFNYDIEKNYFSVPDGLVIEKDFKVLKNETRELGLQSTVGGNAELTRGAANMMYYFRDWVKNGFDKSFGKERYQGIEIFPKESFFALSMGVGSVPLRNLTREGLVGYTLNGVKKESSALNSTKESASEECAVADDNDPVTTALLVNVSPSGHGDIVKSADIARFILAADTFIESTEGVEGTKAAPLQKVENGMKATLKAVRCGQKSLKALMMGLANFLVSKMQLTDGGFASEYSINNKKIVSTLFVSPSGDKSRPNRQLEDQLLIIQALKKVFDRWQGMAYANLAVDAYHYMNRVLFSAKLGFYKVSELSSEDEKVDLRLMSMTLETFKSIEVIVPSEDIDQLNFLSNTWSQKLLDFSKIIKN